MEIEEWLENRCGVDGAFDELKDAYIYEPHGETVDVAALRRFVENL